MNCPNCNSEMAGRMIAEVMIDECDNCGVLWFDRGELEVYRKKYYTKEIDKDVLFNQFKEFEHIVGRRCPKCGSDKFMISKKDQDVLGKCSGCSGILISLQAMKLTIRETTSLKL